MQAVTLGQQQLPVQLFVFIAGQFQFDDLLTIKGRGQSFQLDVQAFVQKLKVAGLVWMGQHTTPVVEKAFKLHVTDGAQSVKPAVSGLLHCLGKAHLLNTFFQRLAGGGNRLGKGPVVDDGKVALDFQRCNALGRNAIGGGLAGYCGNKVGAGLWSIALDGGGVHDMSLMSSAPAGVRRYFCRRLLGLSGMVISICPSFSKESMCVFSCPETLVWPTAVAI